MTYICNKISFTSFQRIDSDCEAVKFALLVRTAYNGAFSGGERKILRIIASRVWSGEEPLSAESLNQTRRLAITINRTKSISLVGEIAIQSAPYSSRKRVINQRTAPLSRSTTAEDNETLLIQRAPALRLGDTGLALRGTCVALGPESKEQVANSHRVIHPRHFSQTRRCPN